jgi:hypothetical protein
MKERQSKTQPDKNPKILDRYEVSKMKIAFQAAVCARTCPPDHILLLFSNEKRARRHLEVCSFCQERKALKEELEKTSAWASTEETFSARRQANGAKNHLEPGCLYNVTGNLAGWGEDYRYYNSPTVLLLAPVHDHGLPGIGKRWRVAQTWHDKTLMGPDDVPLGEDMGFAEPWNSYTLSEHEFEEMLGRVSDAVLRQVIDSVDKDFEEIPTQSVLFGFRSLELDLGSFMAMRSLKRLFAKGEGRMPGVVLPFRNRRELTRFMKVKRPGLTIPKQGKDIYEVLVRTSFPEVETALAAESEKGWRIATLLISRGDDLDIIGAYYKITLTTYTDEGTLVAGRVRKSPFGVKELHGWWASKEGFYSRAKSCDLDHETGSFRAYFPGITEEQFSKGKLAFLFLSDG